MNEKPVDKMNIAYRKPKRIFEKSGIVDPDTSYYVVLENVVNSDNQDIPTMVDLGRYFSIFAPRQSGKTTYLEWISEQLHRDSTYVAILLSFQDYSDLDKAGFYAAIQIDLYKQLVNRLKEVHCEKTEAVQNLLNQYQLVDNISFRLLFEELNQLLQFKKIVIFIDEFDGIPLNELGNFLTSLRELYLRYKKIKQKALYSVGLIGIRNITKLIVGGVSPFNIADHVDLPRFSLQNIQDLYAQYTEETNQPFTEAAVKKVYEETAGQPWLVNRLGTILTVKIKPGTVEPIDEKDVEKAIQLLLKEKNAHFDNLYEKAKLYKETFVEIIFDNVEYYPDNEDQSWLEQYGLITEKNGKATVTNNIYKTRYIKTFFREIEVPPEISFNLYTLPGDQLDIERILMEFSRYIAQIGVRAFYQGDKPYEKTGQFLLTAWLFPFSKEGDLRYEVHSGLGRMDILLNYKRRRYIIETKVNRNDDITIILEDGINQMTGQYMPSESVDEGYLVIFDTRKRVGSACKPEYYQVGNKKVTGFNIAIGR